MVLLKYQAVLVISSVFLAPLPDLSRLSFMLPLLCKFNAHAAKFGIPIDEIRVESNIRVNDL